ncbi:MAG: hypothetical protein RBU45_15415 [Myxococcota bacterium]|nr:hypothetical protein [Myxococcota bacterium]
MRPAGGRGRRGLLVALALSGALGAVACGRPDRGCVDEGCPPGQLCDRATGRCAETPDLPTELEELGRHTSAAVAPDGTVWFATWARGKQHPVLAVASSVRGSDLTVELLAEGAGLAEGVSLALRSGAVAGEVGILVAFNGGAAGRLRLAERDEEGWSIETIDARPAGEARPGGGISLTVDAAGLPWIASHDEESRGLAVVHQEDTRWVTEAVDLPDDEGGRRGLYPAIVRGNGRTLVAHYDEGGGDLRVSSREAGGWQTTLLAGRDPVTGEDTGDVGRFASLRLDPLGNAAVAFFDGTRGQLLFAFNDQGLLRIEVVDPGANEGAALRPASLVGQYASLVYGREGRPRIAYLDAAALDLMLAERSDTGWTRQRIVTEGVVGLWASQAVDAEGRSVVVHTRLSPGHAAGEPPRRTVEVVWP